MSFGVGAYKVGRAGQCSGMYEEEVFMAILQALSHWTIQ